MNEKETIDDLFEGEEEIDDVPEDTGNDDAEVTAEDGDEGAHEDTAEPEKKDEPTPAPEPEPEPEPEKPAVEAPEVIAERAKNEKTSDDLKRLLDALGYEDVDSYLADQAGVSRDEYVERERDARILAEAKAQAARAKYERMAAEDLAALKAAGLVDTTVSHVSELTNARRFAELREMGLSTIEAYRAAAGSSIDARIEKKAQRVADTKAHLTPPKSRGTSGHGSVMSAKEKSYYREILPDASDKELEDAWRRAKGIK